MAGLIFGKYNSTLPSYGSGNDSTIQTDVNGRLIIVGTVSLAEAVGSVTWGAPTAVAVTAGPASTTLVGADATRKALRIWNPIGNAQMSYDIAGGAAVLATGTPLLAGDMDQFTGADCPVGVVTFIGTAGQSLVYQVGT